MANLFIVFDGLDGSGKGMMIKKLEEYLKGKGKKVAITKEPTEGRYGKEVKEILKKDKDPKKNAEKCLDLYIKDRQEHIKAINELLKNNIVICDRYYYSTMAFQHTQGIPLNRVIELNENFIKPDITFILDLPPEIAIERIEKDTTREDKEKFEQIKFMRQLRTNFLNLKSQLSDNITIIDASKTEEEVFNQIKEEIDRLL